MSKKKKRREDEVHEGHADAAYICGSCGEEIVVPIDASAGESQSYVEDCPVCCCPNVISVELEDDGTARVWAELE